MSRVICSVYLRRRSRSVLLDHLGYACYDAILTSSFSTFGNEA